MLFLLFPDPLPFSVHPQEGSLRTSSDSVLEHKQQRLVRLEWLQVQTQLYDSRGPTHGGGGVTPPVLACILWQVPAREHFCKSRAECTWMLSNPIQGRGQICKWCCPLGISSTKLCQFKPICNCIQRSIQPPRNDSWILKQLHEAPWMDKGKIHDLDV